MQRRLSSFLVRIWDRADGTRRVEIEHIQDGVHEVVDSLPLALGWIDARADAGTREDPARESGRARDGPPTAGEPPP